MRLLLLEHDPHLISAVKRGLEASGVELLVACSVTEACRQLQREPCDAALLDCDLLADDELHAFAGLPLVLSTACLEPAGGHRFFGRGALLGKPYTSAQLTAALQYARVHRGERYDGLLDVLRRAHSDGASFTLRVDDALLVIDHGEVAHAERGRQHGEPALVEILSAKQPAIERLPPRPFARTIERPFQVLMLDVLQRLEDREESAT